MLNFLVVDLAIWFLVANMCMQQLALSYEFDTHYEKINQTKLKQIHQTEQQTRCKFLSIPY